MPLSRSAFVKTYLSYVPIFATGLVVGALVFNLVPSSAPTWQWGVLTTIALALLGILVYYPVLLSQRSAGTEHKKMQKALLESNAFIQASLDGANYSIITTGLDGTIITFNAAAERMLNYRADDVVGKTSPILIHDVDEVNAHAESLSRELGRTIVPGFEVFVAKAMLGIAEEREWSYIRKDGSRFPVLLSVTAIRTPDGATIGYMGIAYDITERKQIERMKDEFISTVSHELRTPLTSIRGSLGLLDGGFVGALPVESTPLINIAVRNCERLTRLINDILDLDKIELGKIDFNIKPTDVMSVIEQAIAANHAYAEQFHVMLDLTASLPGAKLNASGRCHSHRSR